MKNTISISQIGTFQDCQYKWYIKYAENIRRRKGELSPSSIGSAVHAGLAAALNTLDGMRKSHLRSENKQKKLITSAQIAIRNWSVANKADSKEVPMFVDEDENIIMGIDEGYETAWAQMIEDACLIAERTIINMDLVNRYEVVRYNGLPLIEHKIEVDLSLALGWPPDSYGFVGIIDAVLLDKLTGAVCVVDWKLHGRFTDLNSEMLNSQIAVYQHALRLKYGINAQLGIVYQIKRDPPRKPTLNKDKSMSRRKINSDWPTYKAALIEAGLRPEDYEEEMAPKLADVEFYRPLMVFRTEQITQKFWDNLLKFARTLIKTDKFPMALGYSCRRCVFAALCNARIYELDTEGLFEDLYEYVTPIEDLSEDEELEELSG